MAGSDGNTPDTVIHHRFAEKAAKSVHCSRVVYSQI